MLDPFYRRHLIDALRPPTAYTLDRAIGTTYSLDLLALLTAPLAFTFFDYEADDAQEGTRVDPVALLEALRRYADRIAIFCDAGRIAVPQTTQLLYSYLEHSVLEVSAPAGGVFHPKIWLLRFLGPSGAIAYRLLCLSRNLTFDRSWDTALVLDGVLTPTRASSYDTAPLASFVATLPGLVVGTVISEFVQETVTLMAGELLQVTFELPPGFDALVFHPLGLPAIPQRPFHQPVDRSLVVSPFLGTTMLRLLADRGQKNVLISRLEELQVQPQELLQRFAAIYTLSDAADLEEPTSEGEEDLAPPLAGLHAKLYVGDAGDRAHLWTGSANATEAAFQHNVEFLAQLSGPIQVCGVDAVLGAERETGLVALMEPFDPRQTGIARDTDRERLEALAERWQRQVARMNLTAHVQASDSPEQFDVLLNIPEDQRCPVPPSITLTCWPITLGAGSGASLEPDRELVARFRSLSYEALTTFYAIQIVVREQSTEVGVRFVVNVPLNGAPADRRQRLLRAMLQSRAQVLRFLLMLLADNGAELEGISRAARLLGEDMGSSQNGQLFGLPLFEAMMRALDRDPTRLAHIARLVDDLRSSPETSQLLPDDFDAIWQPIREAYAGVKA